LYSRDRNLWHISHEGGPLEHCEAAPEENMFQLSVSPFDAPNEPEKVEIGFEHGKPVTVNGKLLSPATIVEILNSVGGKHGIGRIDLVENRLVGMKSRGVYETPGGTLLYAAHKELESITLDRETLHFKECVSQKYAELVYFGQWFTPLREALDAFFEKTQEKVTGEIQLNLYKGNIIINSRTSPNNLYREEYATFGHSPVYDQSDAAGFIRLFGLSSKVKAMMEMGVELPSMDPNQIQRD
jgi:argininosuccinate synthase